jgi:predicted RND superfamily exporter protein
MLVVGMSDVIHLISKYLEEIRQGKDKLTALRIMVKKVGVATLLTSLTTALGFATLIGVSIEPIQLFGMYTAIGVVLAFVLSILFIPAVMLWLKKPKVAVSDSINSGWHHFLGKLFIMLCRKQKAIIVLFGILTIVSLWGASKIKFDYFLMQDLNEDHALMQDLRFFQNNYGGIRPFELAILPKGNLKVNDYRVLKEVDKLSSYLDSAYQVNQKVDPTVPFKFVNQMMRDNKSEYFRLPSNEKRFEYIKKQMKPFENKAEWDEIISDDLKMGRIFGRMVDPGSHAMLKRNADLEQFYRNEIDTNVIAYKLTGSPVIVDQSGRYVSKSVFYGLLVAFALIAVSMGFLFRSLKMALFSLVPNIFPILFTAGFIGFAQIDLNMSTAIVFTIAFGIAVDDTIHFLSRYQQELKNGRSRLYAVRRTYLSTGKAIIITTIILLGGFGSLMFSAFLTTFYIGLFVTMTLVLAVITDLTLLPLLLLGTKKAYLKPMV